MFFFLLPNRRVRRIITNLLPVLWVINAFIKHESKSERPLKKLIHCTGALCRTSWAQDLFVHSLFIYSKMRNLPEPDAYLLLSLLPLVTHVFVFLFYPRKVILHARLKIIFLNKSILFSRQCYHKEITGGATQWTERQCSFIDSQLGGPQQHHRDWTKNYIDQWVPARGTHTPGYTSAVMRGYRGKLQKAQVKEKYEFNKSWIYIYLYIKAYLWKAPSYDKLQKVQLSRLVKILQSTMTWWSETLI